MLVLDGVQQGFDLERGKKREQNRIAIYSLRQPAALFFFFFLPPRLRVFARRSRWGTVIRILEARSVGPHQTGSL